MVNVCRWGYCWRISGVDYDISSIQNLHKAFEITRNASSQLNQLKQKYEAAGMASSELNQKHNMLSAQKHNLGNYNLRKQEFATNYARLIRYRQLIKDAELEDISRLKLWIDDDSLESMAKSLRKNADSIENYRTLYTPEKKINLNSS